MSSESMKTADTRTDTQHLLTVENLETVFRTEEGTVRAVDQVDFHLDQGEILGLVGESGAGKSTAARSVLRLIETPGEIIGGKIEFNGTNVLEMNEAELREYRGAETGMVFQDPTGTLNPTMTVGKQVAEAVEVHQELSEQAAREEAIRLLERVGIPNPEARFDEYPHQFSGGQKQRVVIAIAIASEPDLLVADEPTSALDVTIQAQILDLLLELRDDLGMSILFITHDLGVIRELCDRVAVMYAGSVVEMGEVERVFQNPRHPYSKGLLISNPGLDRGESDSEKERDRLDVIEGTMPDLTGGFEGCKYADRCPGAVEECRDKHPALEQPDDIIEDHAVACYRHEEIDEINYEYEHEPRSLAWQSTHDADSTDETLLSAQNLKKHFRSGGFLDRFLGEDEPIRAVDGIDLKIDPGETLGLVGESGCGKSTAARAILRLLEPTDGTVVYRGQNVTEAEQDELRALRRDLQILFQNPQSSLNPRRTVRQILSRPMKLHNLGDHDERQRRAEELIEEVGLDIKHLERYPQDLSGGQQQRVAIARALAVNPEVILLDEPVSGLDVSIQAQILNLLADLQDELDLAYLFISHNLSVIEEVCDTIAVMYLGEIVEYGTVEEVFSPPYHPYTESLLSAIPGKAQDQERIVLEGDVPNPSNIPTGCRFHPRCPHKIGTVCEDEEPETHNVNGHEINCHLMREEYSDEVSW